MEEIKNKSMNEANSSAGQLLKIDSLEKEVSIFRDESLKLFERLEEKENKIQLLSKQLQDLTEENVQL